MNFVEDVLEAYPSSQPALVTISADGERRVWAFGELIARSSGLAGAFAARGVRRGDVVMTLVGNRIEWALTLLACWRMGAVVLPCNTQLRRSDLELRAGATNPRLCVGEPQLLANLGGEVERMTLAEVAATMDEESPQAPPADPADLAPEDPALIVFTSGTTGEPRAAVHAQRYLEGQRTQATRWLGARPGELVWCTTATGWSKSARNVFVAPWLCGAAALLHEGRFDPTERLDACEREHVNVLCQAPTEYRMLAKRTTLRPLPEMRRMVSAGEPLNPEVIEAFRAALGLEIADGYGQTETGQVTGNLEGEPVREGSMGKPLPGIETRIADGELQLRVSTCPTFFSRYLDSEPFDGEWWPTGDVVHADADGYLFYEGRADDLILSSGYRIGPFEVESALLTHPAVAEAAA
ncbi:MAG: acetyl-CoA synthetase, partial [Solirubrobacterales bacterium]|nr:acetyl-CoA synthetase [Solirubrobacterales bacterium]